MCKILQNKKIFPKLWVRPLEFKTHPSLSGSPHWKMIWIHMNCIAFPQTHLATQGFTQFSFNASENAISAVEKKSINPGLLTKKNGLSCNGTNELSNSYIVYTQKGYWEFS